MRAPHLLVLSILVAGLGRQAADAPGLSQPGNRARAIVVVSDLSMGVGRDRAGAWHPYEDFRWTAEFTAFLKAINAEGEGGTSLILNGDTFELLQSTQKDCTYSDADLGCTESEALARFERVLTAHDTEIIALGQFARAGSNHLTFVPGDHDAALLFPSVGRRLLKALGAPEDHVDIAASGYWLSADGQVYAEHGHQIGFNANKFGSWPSPFVRRAGRVHLERPWGEQTTQEFFNRYEDRYPILDNVAEEGLGVKYVLAAEGTTDAGDAARRLLRYFLFKMSYAQFRLTDYTEGEPPVYELAKIRAGGPAFLVGSLADDDPFKPLATKALTDGRLANAMTELTDDELIAMCDYHRGAIRRARRRMEGLSQFPEDGPAVAECPRTPDTRGPTFEYFWRSRDLMFTRQLAAAAKQVPRSGRPIVVFVHGHTNLPDRSQALYNQQVPQGFSPVRKAAAPIVINGGGWQRTMTPVQLDRMKAARGSSYQDLLRSLQPEQLAACYGFVHIAPYTGLPAPTVRYWRLAGKGDWQLAASCAGGE